MAPVMNEVVTNYEGEKERFLTLHRQIGLKKGNDWRVLRAAWHLVTVGVEQVTERKCYLITNYLVLARTELSGASSQ